MDKRVRMNSLYDYYKDLFTMKQQTYFENYYFDNYSLSEIAENNNISRNAVHNQLKIVSERLDLFEDVLGLFTKREKVLALLDGNVNEDIINKIQEIL